MPPRFQSSFIPKGPTSVSTTAHMIPTSAPIRQHDLLGFLARIIFTLAILSAAGAFGYKWYLGYSIRKMGAELEATRQEVSIGVTGELIRLNDRIVSTQSLLGNHRVLSPLFAFLQASTPKSVRFSDFAFSEGTDGIQVILRGQARSYAALALEADVIEKDKDFQNPVFSEIRLDDKGNVTFAVKATVSSELISYDKTVGRVALPVFVPPATSTPIVAATSTATSTPKATTTPR